MNNNNYSKDGFPLSFAQEQLWVHEKIHPNTLMYNLVHGYEIKGHIEIERLIQSINIMINRHEILRTKFKVNSEGKPSQLITTEKKLIMNFLILQELLKMLN